MTKSIFFTVAGTALLSVSLTSFAASPAADLAQEKEVVCAAFYSNAAGLQSLHGDKTWAVKKAQSTQSADKLKVRLSAIKESWEAALVIAKETDLAAFTLQLGEVNAKHQGSTPAEVGAIFLKFIKEREVKLGCNKA